MIPYNESDNTTAVTSIWRGVYSWQIIYIDSNSLDNDIEPSIVQMISYYSHLYALAKHTASQIP